MFGGFPIGGKKNSANQGAAPSLTLDRAVAHKKVWFAPFLRQIRQDRGKCKISGRNLPDISEPILDLQAVPAPTWIAPCHNRWQQMRQGPVPQTIRTGPSLSWTAQRPVTFGWPQVRILSLPGDQNAEASLVAAIYRQGVRLRR